MTPSRRGVRVAVAAVAVTLAFGLASPDAHGSPVGGRYLNAVSLGAGIGQAVADADVSSLSTLSVMWKLCGASVTTSGALDAALYPYQWGDGGAATFPRELPTTFNQTGYTGSGSCAWRYATFDIRGHATVYVWTKNTTAGAATATVAWNGDETCSPCPVNITNTEDSRVPVDLSADDVSGGGSESVTFAAVDRERLDLIWWGVWGVVGLLLVTLFAQRWYRTFDPTRGL